MPTPPPFYRVVLEISRPPGSQSYQGSLRVGAEAEESQELGSWEFTLDPNELQLLAEDSTLSPEERDRRYGKRLAEQVFPPLEAVKALAGWSEYSAYSAGAGSPVYFRVRLPRALAIEDRGRWEQLNEIHWEKLVGPQGSPVAGTFLIEGASHLARECERTGYRRELLEPAPPAVDLICFAANPIVDKRWGLAPIETGHVQQIVAAVDHQHARKGERYHIGVCPAGTDLTPATLENLRIALNDAAKRDRPYILCILCHGVRRRDEQNKIEVNLALENTDGSVAWIPVDELIGIVAALRRPPLCAALLICNSANGPSLDRTLDEPTRDRNGPDFVGLGPTLAEQGVHAVLAMQGNVPTVTAIQTAQSFLREVLGHGQADMAMLEARQSITGQRLGDRWRPALFLGRTDGRLWRDPREQESSGADESESLDFSGTELVAHLESLRGDKQFLNFLPLKSFLPADALISTEEEALDVPLHEIYVQLDIENLEALTTRDAAAKPFYVLKGGPGSGKTTFLQHLIVRLADAALKSPPSTLSNAPVQLAELSALGVYVPVYIKFSDYFTWFNRRDESKASSDLLWRFVEEHTHSRVYHATNAKLAALREKGKFWFFVDAIDEIPSGDKFNSAMYSIISAMASEKSDNHLLVTCRAESYDARRKYLVGLKTLELAGLTKEKQKDIVMNWYRCLNHFERYIQPRKPFSVLEDDFLRRIERNEFKDVSEFKLNPLLLTMLILVLTFQDELPQRDIELYERSIEYMLYLRTVKNDQYYDRSGWVISAGRFSLSVTAFRDVVAIAAYVLATTARENQSSEQSLISEIFKVWYAYLSRPFIISHVGKRISGEELLQLVKTHGGALVRFDHASPQFSHKIFRDYLAAKALLDPELPLESMDVAGSERDLASRVLRCLSKGGESWLSIVQMVGKILVYQGRDRDLAYLIESLVQSGSRDRSPPVLLQTAGQLLLDHARALTAAHERGDEHTRSLFLRVINETARQLNGRLAAPSEQLSADVGKLFPVLWEFTAEFKLLLSESYPMQGLLEKNPKGQELAPFLMRQLEEGRDQPATLSAKDVIRRFDIGRLLATIGDTRPGVVNLPIEWVQLSGQSDQIEVSLYPVTLGQFLLFFDDGGYKKIAYWANGTSKGFEADVDSLNDTISHTREPALFSVLHSRLLQNGAKEQSLNKLCKLFLNIPMCYINYYEAQAFCSWLSKHEPDGAIRLPTPEEWRAAAGASDSRSHQAIDNLAAVWQDLLPAVGLFPMLTVDRDGAQDMGLFINEWCQSESARPTDYNIPLAPVAGRLPEIDMSNARIQLSDLGFRVVKVPRRSP